MDDGRYTAAARLYEQVLESRPDSAPALVGAAEAWARAGEGERAVARAQEAHSRGLPGAEEALAQALVRVGRGAEARELLPAASGEAALWLAEAHLAAGDPASARTVLQRASGPEAEVLDAWMRWRVDGPPACAEAVAQAKGAAAAAYESVPVLADAAAVAFVCGDAEAAADLARQARTFYLDGSGPLVQAATQRQAGGDLEGAARLLTRAVALYAQEGRPTRDLGALWYLLDEPAQAASWFVRALPLAPYQQDPARHEPVIGGFGMEQDERQAACRELWRDLAAALTKAGDPRNAVAARERSLLLDPAATGQAWADLALDWSKVGQHAQATAAGQQALKLDGAAARSWLVMADVRFAAGAASEAAGYARRAWEIDPGDPVIAVRLAEAALAIGEAAEAQRTVETAIRELRGAIHPLSGRLQALLNEATAR